MIQKQRVRLCRSGGGKAVQIPRAFEFAGDEAIISTDGQQLTIEPIPTQSLSDLLATLSPTGGDFLPIEDLP